MFESLKYFINKLFNKDIVEELEGINFDELLPDRLKNNVRIPVDRIVSIYDSSKPSIIIIDDSVFVVEMVCDYLTILNITEEKFNILKFYGMNAPFVLKDTLKVLKDKGLVDIEYAIIDIVLPSKMREDGKYSKMDGIDVSILLREEYQCKKFLFFSGNVLNLYIDFIQEKVDKFYEYFSKDLREYIVIKTKGDDFILDKLDSLFKNKIVIDEKK